MTITDAALLTPCSYCGAGSGSWCVRRRRYAGHGDPTGRASYLHEARLAPIREVWVLGWREGVAQVIDDLRRWAVEFPDAPNVALLEWAADRVEKSWVARRI